MKNVIVLFLLCSLFSCSGQEDAVPQNLQCDVMDAVFKDIIKEDSLSEIKVFNEFIEWHEVAFDFPEGKLPKNSKEREERLNAEHDIYSMLYMFSAFFTDTIFSEEDREFMNIQSKNKANKFIICKSPDIQLINKNETRAGDSYGFCKPVFSKDYKFAALYKVTNFEWADEVFHGLYQQQFYRYDKKNGWTKFYSTGYMQ